MWWRRESETEDCSDCGTNGRIECSECHGDYKQYRYVDGNGFWWKCSACINGSNQCRLCGGTGQWPYTQDYCNNCNRSLGIAHGCCPYCGAD